ncbi:MAG: hypothetical protein M1319_01870 [Chloroflexi bacterium]|nr:hypothetical protein [Chloroflexota bacterium]
MRQTLSVYRSVVAVLLVAFGLMIAGRGVIGGAPLMFTAMGLIMAALGAYRLKLMFARPSGRR